MARRGRHRCRPRWPSGCWPSSSTASTSTGRIDALLAGLVVGLAQRGRLADAGVRRRADLGADPGDRRDRARRAARRPACWTGCRGSTLDGFWTALVHRRSGWPRSPRSSRPCWRSTTTPGSTSAWPALARRRASSADRHRRAGHRVRPAGRAGRGRAASGPCARATCRRWTAGCATGTHRLSVGRRAGRRRPGSASAASSTARRPTCRRSAGSTRRPGHGRRVEPPGVGGRHRARALRRPGAAGPPRLQLRQPVLRRRRAGRADDERHRPAQGGPPRRRLRRLLLPPAAGDPHAARRGRRRSPASGGPPCCSAAAASSRASHRGWTYALLRAFTTVVSRDVSVQGVLNDVRRGPRRDLRRPARLRRGRPPLRARAGRHAGRAARPRPPDRPHRPVVAVGAAAVPPRRAVRPRPDPGRAVQQRGRRDAAPSSSAGCAAGRRRATPTPSRARPSRAPGCARPVRRTVRTTPVRGGRRPDRARLGQPRADHAARTGPPADPRGDRRALPGADPRTASTTRTIGFVLVASADGRRWCSAPGGSRNLATGEVVGDDPLGAVRAARRRAGAGGRRATRPPPT